MNKFILEIIKTGKEGIRIVGLVQIPETKVDNVFLLNKEILRDFIEKNLPEMKIDGVSNQEKNELTIFNAYYSLENLFYGNKYIKSNSQNLSVQGKKLHPNKIVCIRSGDIIEFLGINFRFPNIN